MEALALPLEVC
ncbi:hypothetical protein GQ600_22234 [Phytophthora cactorum]|nr:hypothetical protein GQ600_22234 [Phytophthora cactorum]